MHHVLTIRSTVKRVPFADHIIVLEKHGYVTEQGSFSSLNAAGGYISSFALNRAGVDTKISTMHKNEPSSVSEYPPQRASDVELESYRGDGDMSIYLYYIQSVGWLQTVAFAVAITGFVFCISFPSKFVVNHTSSCTNFIGSGIWVKWWANSNETNPGKHTGYYLGVYAMLGGVGMLCIVAGTWFVTVTLT
jgi:hypothetical protein